MDKFTIVIPVYNEANNLGILIPKIYKELINFEAFLDQELLIKIKDIKIESKILLIIFIF